MDYISRHQEQCFNLLVAIQRCSDLWLSEEAVGCCEEWNWFITCPWKFLSILLHLHSWAQAAVSDLHFWLDNGRVSTRIGQGGGWSSEQLLQLKVSCEGPFQPKCFYDSAIAGQKNCWCDSWKEHIGIFWKGNYFSVLFFSVNVEVFVFKKNFWSREISFSRHPTKFGCSKEQDKLSRNLKKPSQDTQLCIMFCTKEWHVNNCLGCLPFFFLFVCLFLWFFSLVFFPQWDQPVICASAASVVTAFWWELRKPDFEILIYQLICRIC